MSSYNDWQGALSLWCAGAKVDWPSDSESWGLLRKHGLDRHGIQHVVECPALARELEMWNMANGDRKEKAEKRICDLWRRANGDMKEKAENRIRNLFVSPVQVIFIPVFGMEEEKKKELRRNVKEWNKGGSRPKCEWMVLKSYGFWCLIPVMMVFTWC